MVEIFGKNYYIDLEGVTDKCRISGVKKDDNDNEEETIEINLFKYEIIKMCIERVLYEQDEVDEDMGIFGKSVSPSFKLAFNTLIKNEILIEEDE